MIIVACTFINNDSEAGIIGDSPIVLFRVILIFVVSIMCFALCAS